MNDVNGRHAGSDPGDDSVTPSTSLADQRLGKDPYSPKRLKLYDFWVHVMNNHVYWRCPTRVLLKLYNDCITDNHLEIGLGTGYFLDRCSMPVTEPRLVLCDISENCLEMAAQRIARYQPQTFQRDAMEPIEGLGAPFRSVGMNYVLHCIRGPMAEKTKSFNHVANLLQPGGVFFGSTILTRGVPVSWLAKAQIRVLTRMGFFDNGSDSLADLEAGLSQSFARHELHVHGCVGVFKAWVSD